MEKAKIIDSTGQPCPECGSRDFKYHPQDERRIYKDKVIVGKYECVRCNWQSGLNGEI